MATTVYYDPGKAHTSATTLNSAADHYHTFDVSAINQWIKGSSGVPSNAKITKVEFQLSTYISSSLANVDLSLYLGSGENNGTNLGSKGDVGTSSKTYTWDLTSYYSGSGHNTYPFTMNTSQPHLVPYWTVNYIFSIKVYCPTVRLAVTYEIPTYTITANVNNSYGGTVSGGGTYESGSSATLTAKANDGYKFIKWSDGVTTASRTVTVTGAATYTAVFEKLPPEYTSVAMTYLGKQISEANKVPCGEGFIISVGVK